jgi:hypothetical protein
MEAQTITAASDASAPEACQPDTRLADSQSRLDELRQSLAAVEAELEAFAAERRQHNLLRQACGALDELREAGGADLFWNGVAAAAERAGHLQRVRARTDEFLQRVGQIEDRRRLLVEELGQQHEQHFLLEDEAFEKQEEEERLRNEWLVDRELEAARVRPHLMPWQRNREEDGRFRRNLGIALALWLLIAIIAPFIELPVRTLKDQQAEEQRVVSVIPETRKLQQAPPPPKELQKPAEPKVENKPVEQMEQQPVAKEPEAPQPQGILAFKDQLKSVQDMPSVAALGKAAKVSGDEAARPERAMLTSNAPGSSGGIQLGSQSRGFGQGAGAERGAIQGAALTRASSNIAPASGADKPLAGDGMTRGRTGEEIQIVFDRYKAALYRLYQRELRRDATLQGKVILRLTIEPDGSVSMSQLVSSEMNAPDLTGQIVERVKGFNFGAKDVPVITIVYPMDFLPAG